MTMLKYPALLAVCLLACTLPATTTAADARISELTSLDRQYMARQRESIDAIARRYTGSGFTGQPLRDVPLLQRLLDDRRVAANDTQKLQAMGILLGDLLARERGMRWVIYEDRLGRSRALRYRETDSYLFPVTMISRRREAGSVQSVREIYDAAMAIIRQVREPLPFE